jgi:uncharacterized protein YcbK (DUF882 family)
MAGLTPHFRTEEFDCHDGTPVPAYAYDALRHLCRGWLEPLRRAWGPVTIISGFRTPEHNRSVGGAPGSYHVYRATRAGVAADVRCARGRPADWKRTLERLEAHGLGIYSAHVHVDTRPGSARW